MVIPPPINNGGQKQNFLVNLTKEIYIKKSRYSDSQILAIIKQAESGVPIPELCREHGMGGGKYSRIGAKIVQMIKIIDYGLGNVQAFLNIYKILHIPVQVAKSAEDLDNATKLILPGVGHFDYAMQSFNVSGMREKVTELVLQRNIPILGVCVGMQMMADSSEEGEECGLGWIHGVVKGLASIVNNNEPLPHMGWNNIQIHYEKGLFKNMNSGDLEFYFLHSYYFDCASKENCIAEADYSSNFCCAVNNKNIFGVQFHPEKSHHYGVNLLRNFAEI